MRNSNGKTSEKRSAIVVGGGLVGALCVCVLAKRGYKVTMYEKRDDIRKAKMTRGRSINLALSHRGRKALRLAGIEMEVLENAVPMRGRLLHTQDGQTESDPYDPISNQCIYSVGRNLLNNILLNVAEKYPNVTLMFKYKLINVDCKTNSIVLLNVETEDSLETTADLIVGADGAFSTLRSALQRMPFCDFSQSCIDHGYLELYISPDKGAHLQANHLHVWPRGEFMMIALPNQDRSWTVTLFMPFKKFEAIDESDKLFQFFKTTFSDALPLVGRKVLETTYFGNPPSPLVSIKCGRYHMRDRFLIIGDAAHAMVPFYGQGMNAGFEDCTLLNDILNEAEDNIPKAIKMFTERRQKDAYAICDLAMYNYLEMRDLVTKPSFKLRKMLDRCLGKMLPDIWIPLYNSVSFSHMGYSQCAKNRHWQDKVLFGVFPFVAGAILILFCIFSIITFI